MTTITVYCCSANHVYFFRHARCPQCADELTEKRQPPQARLVAQTKVRVNPARRHFRLGIAEIDSGARTLCIIDDRVAEEEPGDVILRYTDGLYYALPVS